MTKEYQNEIEKIDDSMNPVPKLNVPNAFNMFQTVTSVPTVAPSNWQNQIQIYTSGSTYRLYWWDNTNNTWHYVTATA